MLLLLLLWWRWTVVLPGLLPTRSLGRLAQLKRQHLEKGKGLMKKSSYSLLTLFLRLLFPFSLSRRLRLLRGLQKTGAEGRE